MRCTVVMGLLAAAGFLGAAPAFGATPALGAEPAPAQLIDVWQAQAREETIFYPPAPCDEVVPPTSKTS